MKKVLITGGAGFIGSNYVHYNAEKYPDDKIFVLDKLTYAGNLDNIQHLIDSGKVTFIEMDIANQSAVNELFKKEKFSRTKSYH